MNKDPLFKALTRPAMFLGVPLTPFFLTFAGFLLLAMYTKIYYFIFFLPAYGALKLISSYDEKIFQLYGIKMWLMPSRFKAAKFKKLFGGNYYISSNFSKETYRKKPISDKGEYTMLDLEKAISLEKIIPYSSQIDDDVILTKDGIFTATFEVEGISYETRGDDDLDRFKLSLNILIRSLAQDNISIYMNSVRRFSDLKLDNQFDDGFAKEINEKYVSSFSKSDFMENNLFFTVALKPYKGIDKVNVKNQSKDEKLSDIQANLAHFKEILGRVENALNKFGCSRLTCYEENGVVYSQQLELFNFLLTGNYQKVRVLNKPIYSYLGNIQMIAGVDIAEIRLNDKKTFVRGIEIKDWVQDTHSGFLDVLMQLNCRYNLTQSFTIVPKQDALKTLNRQIKRMQATQDDGISQLTDLEFAKDELVSGKICFGDHHFTLMLYGDTIEEVQKYSNQAITKLSELGFIVTLSNIALDEAYFSQLPCNFRFRPRVSMISSKNFVGLNSLHNNPIGKAENNCWGNAVSLLRTSTNTPFYFNFHQTKMGRDDRGDMHLGHTLVLGKSGTGKTVLATFLLSQLTAFSRPETFLDGAVNKKLTAIYLDKDYGAEIAIRAMGGQYNRLKNGLPTHFNPFMLDKTEENISFLNTLIGSLATSDGSTLSTKEKIDIDKAIRAVLSLDKLDREYGITRLLENIQEDTENPNSLYSRLTIWKKGGIYGWVFDNETDQLSFDDRVIYGFDGTEILDNAAVINAIAYYLLYRVQQTLDGRRVVVFLDEFWKWLQGESFREFTFDGLKTMRKKNGFVVPITQSPSEILKSDIARAIIEQVETFIYLPNSKADRNEYMTHFKVSEQEFDLITGLEDDSRMFLVKKGNENDNRGNTVIAKLDLSALDRGDLKVLSGSADNIPIIDRIIEEYGDNPKDWLPVFRSEMEKN